MFKKNNPISRTLIDDKLRRNLIINCGVTFNSYLGSGGTSSNSSRVHWIHLCAKNFVKSINSAFLPPTMGKIA